jgi:hypothetical protein
MMYKKSTRNISIAALTLLTIFTFAWVNARPSTLKKAEIMISPRLSNIFQKIRPVCIGRFIIDVPASAEVIYGPAQIPFDLEVYRGKGPMMDELIHSRLVEIESERKYAEGRLLSPEAIIGKVMDGALQGQKIIFGVSQRSGVFYRLQSYLRRGDDLFVQEIDAIAKKEKYENEIQRLNSMASLLRSRGDQEIPQIPGICVEDGFVIEPPEQIREYVSIGIRLKEFPDVHFSMATTSNKKWDPADALEPRLKQAEENARARGLGNWYSRIKTLRRGDRELGKWKGFEILARLPAQATEGESHEFNYVSQGDPKSPFLPLLELELRTGVRGNDVGGAEPSIGDDEAVTIWDKLTGSIRVRPTK